MNISQVKNMKNKFTITEGESQRILGLHKKAILKENKIILSEGYKLNLIAAEGWNSGIAPQKWNLQSFKVTKKNGEFLTVTVLDSDGSQFTNCVINCRTKDILTIKSDGEGSLGGQMNGTTYRLGSDLVAAVTKSCEVPKKVVDEPKKVVDEPVKVVPKKEVIIKKEDKKTYISGTKGDRYTCDFDAVMKAIDDTGKCSNIISDVSEVYKQTKQENFLILSDNFTPEKSDLITPEGTKWKTNARLSKDGKKAYTIVGSDDYSLVLSDGLLFTCDPTLANNVTYSFFYLKTKKLYSNEELGSILKNQFCDGKINQDQNVKDEPIGDKVKSGLNNVVNPINTTISKDKYYEYISS